jgi:DNA-directed RNA polymerase subunit RPC12/RpoP
MGHTYYTYRGGRSRYERENWLGRRRWYKCIKCGNKFMHDSAYSLPKKARICNTCCQDPKVWDEFQTAMLEARGEQSQSKREAGGSRCLNR